MNKFRKYCPNVFVAECDDEYKRGDVIHLETKYGKEIACEVYNLVRQKNDKYYYSIVRVENESYAERKADKYNNAAARSLEKSREKMIAAEEGKEFLILGEPIKVGHHSEKRHRALLERNWNRMEKSVEFADKAEEQAGKAKYWEEKAKEITLAMPESLEYFQGKLEKAIEYHKGLKDGSIPRAHAYSLAYANKAAKDLKKKVEIARKLWSVKEQE